MFTIPRYLAVRILDMYDYNTHRPVGVCNTLDIFLDRGLFTEEESRHVQQLLKHLKVTCFSDDGSCIKNPDLELLIILRKQDLDNRADLLCQSLIFTYNVNQFFGVYKGKPIQERT